MLFKLQKIVLHSFILSTRSTTHGSITCIKCTKNKSNSKKGTRQNDIQNRHITLTLLVAQAWPELPEIGTWAWLGQPYLLVTYKAQWST